MPWHLVEHIACVLWARPERMFCTRVHRAAASHCRLPAPVLVPSHSQPTRPPPPSLQSRPWSPTATPSGRPWQLAADHGRLLPWMAPPEPPSLASCPLEQLEVICKLVC